MGVKPGEQTLQVNGFTSAGAVRSLSLGITVVPARVVTTSNDDSLSTQRARNVASYLRDRGLKGAYVVRGNGVAGSGDAARRVNVKVTYQSGC